MHQQSLIPLPDDEQDPTNALTLPTPLPMSQHPAAVYLASLTSKGSRRKIRGHLTKIARMLTGDDTLTAFDIDWSQVRYAHSAAIRAMLMEQYSPSTVNGILSALRGVLKEAWRLNHMDAETYRRAADIANVKGETLPTGRTLPFGEIQALANACFEDKTPAGARDSAIIGLLAVCGLRRSEVVKLTLDDVDTDNGEIKIRKAKGNKERIVWLRGGALLAMEDWFAVRHPDLTTEAVFVPINKGSRQLDRALSTQAIYELLQRRGDEAEVKDFSPHDFRRTMISEMLAKGADVLTVQKIAGHASSDTTRRYDLRDEKFKQEAAEKLHYPHRARRQEMLL